MRLTVIYVNVDQKQGISLSSYNIVTELMSYDQLRQDAAFVRVLAIDLDDGVAFGNLSGQPTWSANNNTLDRALV